MTYDQLNQLTLFGEGAYRACGLLAPNPVVLTEEL